MIEQDTSATTEQPENYEQVLDVLTEENRELEALFITELENMTHSTMLHLEPRVKLPKCKLDHQRCESGNNVVVLYLREADTIPEISDKVYAMGKAITSKLGLIVDKDQPGKKKENAKGGNCREQKLKKEIKELRQNITKTSNELFRRKQQKKATAKEKAILQELKIKSQKDKQSLV